MSAAPATRIEWDEGTDSRFKAKFDEPMDALAFSDPAVPLLSVVFKLKDAKRGPAFLESLGFPAEMKTVQLLAVPLNCHASWQKQVGQGSESAYSINLLVQLFERLAKPSGRQNERRRRIGEAMVNSESFCQLFTPEVSDGGVSAVMEELQEAEGARREAWEKHVAAQPPPVPVPNAAAIAAIAQALGQLQQPGAAT